jgi:hypothetical protein
MPQSFRGRGKFSDRYSSWMRHLTKDILTTKNVKHTKVSDIFDSKLRDVRSQICFFFFGCGFTTLRQYVIAHSPATVNPMVHSAPAE